jgi:hypothetical protein
MAMYVALKRHTHADRNGWGSKYFEEPSMSGEYQGAAAELLVSCTTGLFWHALADNPKNLPGDVGHCQVRQTNYIDGHLMVHQDDPDGAPFILVTGIAPRQQIRGWLLGKLCKRAEWWQTHLHGRKLPTPAYCVKQCELNAMEDGGWNW